MCDCQLDRRMIGTCRRSEPDEHSRLVCRSVCVCVCVVVVSQSVCLSDIEYHCDSGQCVRASDVCDGHGQCADRSDELNCGKSLCVHPSRTFGDICSTQKSEDY